MRWQEAATAFEDSLRFKDDSAVAPQARLGLAEAYRHLSRQKDAVPLLTQLLDASPDKELEDDALYDLARCQTDLQAWNEAKMAWRQLIRRFPDSHFVPEARLGSPRSRRCTDPRAATRRASHRVPGRRRRPPSLQGRGGAAWRRTPARRPRSDPGHQRGAACS